jgi:hypothetical protein
LVLGIVIAASSSYLRAKVRMGSINASPSLKMTLKIKSTGFDPFQRKGIELKPILCTGKVLGFF